VVEQLAADLDNLESSRKTPSTLGEFRSVEIQASQASACGRMLPHATAGLAPVRD
jgi:hypothetical protein